MADKKLVTMVKEGEEPIDVHPSVVDAHKKVGWSLADPDALNDEQPAEEAKGKTKVKPAKPGTRVRVKKTEEESSTTDESGEG